MQLQRKIMTFKSDLDAERFNETAYIDDKKYRRKICRKYCINDGKTMSREVNQHSEMLFLPTFFGFDAMNQTANCK